MRKENQKRVLVLGGTKHMISVVERAKRMGVSPIVVDNIIGSPAKSYADKFFNTSIADLDSLAQIIREENVDGILTALENISIWNAVALCKKTNLPFYEIDEQLEISSNKDKFKEICHRFDIPVIEERELNGKLEETVIATWEFPIVIKPSKNWLTSISLN